MSHALIIDDDADDLGILKQVLALQDISYTAIQDSSQVAALLPQIDKIDFVLLDLEMPQVHGYQVYQFLKTQLALANVPIVACTVHSGEINRAHDLGFHSFISKPIDLDRFPVQIADILRNTPIWEGR